jgi:HK97 family phage major capsid protein
MARLIWTGLGGAQPVGIATASSTIPVAIEAGQTIANTATHFSRNAAQLLARVRRPDRAAFFVHSDLLVPALTSTTGGTADVRIGPPTVAGAVGTLHGRPLFANDVAPAPGTPGDFACVDLSRYLLATKGVRRAVSVHVRFLHDEHVFRFSVRLNGQPFLGQPVTPYTGSNTKSDAAILAARS